MTTKKSRFPHSLVLIFGIIIVAQVMTYVVTPGEYDREATVTTVSPGEPLSPAAGAEVSVAEDGVATVSTPTRKVIAGSWHEVEAEPLGVWSFLTLVPQGLAKGGEIIFFVFLVGGVIAEVRATGAIHAMMEDA